MDGLCRSPSLKPAAAAVLTPSWDLVLLQFTWVQMTCVSLSPQCKLLQTIGAPNVKRLQVDSTPVYSCYAMGSVWWFDWHTLAATGDRTKSSLPYPTTLSTAPFITIIIYYYILHEICSIRTMITLRRCRPVVLLDPIPWMPLLLPYGLFLVRLSYTTFRRGHKGPAFIHRETSQVCTAPKTTKGKEGNVSSAIWRSSWSPNLCGCFWMRVHDLMLIQMAPSLTHDSSFGLVLPSFQSASVFHYLIIDYYSTINDPYQRAYCFCQRHAQPN
jgi:hypothetical protein